MVTPSQLTVLITAIGYPCRTYTMSNTHRNPQLFKNRALGLKDQKLWKIGVFLGGGGGLVLVNIL